jgi:hypothetical protein
MDVRRSSRAQRPHLLPHRSGVTALTLALLLVLNGCSGGGDEAASGGGSDAMVAESGPAGRAADRSVTSNALDPLDVPARSVIKTAQVSLESKDLGPVRDEIDRLLGRYGGYVDNEETLNDSQGRVSSSTLRLRVPAQDFDAVLTGFEDFATVTDVQQTAEDVTTEVIDVDARVRTAEVSLQRLRTFLGRADTVDAVIRLESEIAEREAELASLRAQQRYLDDQTSLATLTVHMTRSDSPRKEDPLSDAGFLTGLRNGWQALVDVAVVASTVAGALLPFLLVGAAVLVPLLVWLRSRRRRRTGRPIGPMAGPPLAYAAPGGPGDAVMPPGGTGGPQAGPPAG